MTFNTGFIGPGGQPNQLGQMNQFNPLGQLNQQLNQLGLNQFGHNQLGQPNQPYIPPQVYGAPFNQGQFGIPSRTATPGAGQQQFLIPGQTQPRRQPLSTASSPGIVTPPHRSTSPARAPDASRRDLPESDEDYPLFQELPDQRASGAQNDSWRRRVGALPPTTHNPPETVEQLQHQLYLLQDPAGQAVGLIAGPGGGNYYTQLPPDVLNMLVANQLPVDRVDQDFRQFLRNVYLTTIAAQVGHRTPNSSTSSGTLGAENQPPAAGDGAPGNALAQAIGIPPDGLVPNAAGAPAALGARRQPDEMRDALAPIIRNLWLIIRAAGLLYFVAGGGRVLWRPFLLALAVLFIYGIQAGLLGDRFDHIRRWLDRIIGIEGRPRNGRARRPFQAGAAGADRPGPTGSAQDGNAAGNPSPAVNTAEDFARRLVNERAQRNQTWLAQMLRTAERTVGLFIASLWPGVGEQAVRLQEQRQAEERERRRAEEEAAAAANTAADATAGSGAEVEAAADEHAPGSQPESSATAAARADP